MRIITWNLRRANAGSVVWRILKDLNPDIILLQEVSVIPADIKSLYEIEFRPAVNKKGNFQNFGTAVLVKGKIISKIQLSSEFEWVNKEIGYFNGNLVSCIVQTGSNELINVISVYSPAWPISADRIKNIDISQVKLQLSKKLWCTEVLWSALKNQSSIKNDNWVVGGDFNTSETFDYLWKGGPSGNLEIIERMNGLGLNECLRAFNGKLIPTFKNPKGGKVIHQIDHIYASEMMYAKLSNCATGNDDIIFGQSLSDHLPIIADFK